MEAQYSHSIAYPGNPFIEALPPRLSPDELIERITTLPFVDHDMLSMLPPEHRMDLTSSISDLFVPMKCAQTIYTLIYQGIQRSYAGKSSVDVIRQSEIIYNNLMGSKQSTTRFCTQTNGFTILGVPGIGKTTTISRILELLPQVIRHRRYGGKPFVEMQINYIFVQCPADASIKSTCLSMLDEIAKACISSSIKEPTQPKKATVDTLILRISQLCITYHVGIIIIDEIQNIIPRTTHKNLETPAQERFINFLVQLMNSTGVTIALVGTPEIAPFFDRRQHLFRRTRGVNLPAFNFGSDYIAFLDKVWQYQFTKNKEPLSPALCKVMYDYTRGVPALITQLFSLAQYQAILSGAECVTESVIIEAASIYQFRRQRPTYDEISIAICNSYFEQSVSEPQEPVDTSPSPLSSPISCNNLIELYERHQDKKTFLKELEKNTEWIEILS